jgi:hypothetical protein
VCEGVDNQPLPARHINQWYTKRTRCTPLPTHANPQVIHEFDIQLHSFGQPTICILPPTANAPSSPTCLQAAIAAGRAFPVANMTCTPRAHASFTTATEEGRMREELSSSVPSMSSATSRMPAVEPADDDAARLRKALPAATRKHTHRPMSYAAGVVNVRRYYHLQTLNNCLHTFFHTPLEANH